MLTLWTSGGGRSCAQLPPLTFSITVGLHLVVIQDVSAQNPVFELSLHILSLCNVPPVTLVPCLYIGVYHLLGKTYQIFEMSAMKNFLAVPPLLQRKGDVCTQQPVRCPTCRGAHTRSMRLQPRSLHVLWSWERLPSQATGAIIWCNRTVDFVSTIRRKVTDITNAANRGIWHSEHAKKLTLTNCYNRLSSLKKRSLHNLKFNGPRESWSALSFLLLASDDL